MMGKIIKIMGEMMMPVRLMLLETLMGIMKVYLHKLKNLWLR